MDLSELVEAVLSGDLLAARQWVADARRAGIDWESMERPSQLGDQAVVVAAALAELLAARAGARPPSWVHGVGAADPPRYLDPGIEALPRTLARARRDAPEPLRKRNLFALPELLEVR